MVKLRIAVVGCGNVRQGHHLHPERVEVVALADVEKEAAQERRERFKLSRADVYTDWQNAYQERDAWSVPGYHGFMVRDKRQTPIGWGERIRGTGMRRGR